MKEDKTIQTTMSTLIDDVRSIVESGLRKAYQNVNAITVLTYWQVGRRIVEEEQQGARRAEYGAQIINVLSANLRRTYAKGYTSRDLRAYRQFYLCFNDLEIWYSRVPNLTWTHFRTLLSVTNNDARYWYVKEASRQDVGQMDMYVRMFDDLKRTEGDNPTIGLLLCSETSEDIARYSVLHDSKQLFAYSGDSRSPIPMISVHSVGDLLYRRQS
ncbi:MAG: DUF1016 family protein [Prevotella sp.]|nr:DUF1016 family protein [Prevotella sp.]